jgi:hypothetical protein
MHKNEPNKRYSEKTQKDEKIEPIPSVSAKFVSKW